MSFKWTDGTDYLAHHGIKGQKWGVRRFQNEDGSYTAAGQVRRELNSGSSIFSRRANDLRYSPTQTDSLYKSGFSRPPAFPVQQMQQQTSQFQRQRPK